MQTKIINLVGGPCCGKSTTACGLFSLMKLKSDKKVELVTEVIKDYVYANNQEAMNDQVLITAQQNHRLKRLQGKVEYVISDASLLNGVIYDKFYKQEGSTSTELALKLYNLYDNVVFLLPRKPKYDQYGRSQTHEEAIELDNIFIETLDSLGIEYYDMRMVSHTDLPEKIMDLLIPSNMFTIYNKDHCYESIVEVGEEICESLEELPTDEHGMVEGDFQVKVIWKR